jgi:hypothetical protein
LAFSEKGLTESTEPSLAFQEIRKVEIKAKSSPQPIENTRHKSCMKSYTTGKSREIADSRLEKLLDNGGIQNLTGT